MVRVVVLRQWTMTTPARLKVYNLGAAVKFIPSHVFLKLEGCKGMPCSFRVHVCVVVVYLYV